MEKKKNLDYKQMYEAVYMTAKQWIEDGCTDKEKICLECVFPQLREDENEKARKTLLLALTTSERVGELKFVLPPSTREECIDWLNRQENTEGSFGRGYDSGYQSCLHSHGAEWLEKQKESLHIQETCKENADSLAGDNEDESIRKEIIDYLKTVNEVESNCNHSVIDDWLAYLEKQEEPWIPTDEQRFALGMVIKHSDPDADSTKVLESLLDALTKIANPKVAKWKEKQKEQKPKVKGKNPLSPHELNDARLEGISQGRQDVIEHPEQFGLQKPAWSEEDEKMLNRCIQSILLAKRRTEGVYGPKQFDEGVSWLKSLRPQLKQKGSIAKFVEAVDNVKQYRKGYEEGLRDGTKKHWKPSEDQLKDLLNAENALRKHKYIAIADKIAELHYCLEQLKQS